MNKKLLLLLLATTICSMVNAQTKAIVPSANVKAPQPKDFYSIQKQFYDYIKKQEALEHITKSAKEEEEDGELKQFEREENFLKQRVYPTGTFNPEILYTEYQKYKSNHQTTKSINDRAAANWTYIGPTNTPIGMGGGGAGRLNCIVFHPTNPNILFVGAACGGLWKSTDGGNTWASNTDLLPALSISDLAIDPQNPLTMYLATGDKYGYFAGYGFWGGTYSAGLMKSTDGGNTWTQTNLNYTQADISIIQHIVINTLNTNILVVATSNGIFRSTDAGVTWNNTMPGVFTDLSANPLNPNVLYASDRSQVYKSIDGGISWTSILTTFSSPTSRTRVSIATTPADTNLLYVWSDDTTLTNQNFFKSINGGAAFTLMSSPETNASPYGYYDRVLTVAPANPNLVYTGGFGIGVSPDGGNSWTTSSGIIHPDNHDIEFNPTNSGIIYSCNDGGIFKSTDGGNTWNDLSTGLNIKQYYRLSCSATNPNLMYAGAQDNGTDKINNSIATWVTGGDGMDCAIDYTNDNVVYTSYQYGAFSKSTDGGNNFTAVPTTGGGEWTTPIVISPSDNNTIYIGYLDLYKSTDGGASWNNISSGVSSATIYSLEVCQANTNVIYMASYYNIYKTTDGGANWTNITQNLPVDSAAITKIVTDPTNTNNVCVTFSGYSSGNKVFHSIDGGLTWTNISGSLPNIPVNCAVWQNTHINSIYIGTDFGVFYKDSTMTDWIAYNDGLPNVIINDIEIQPSSNKLRVATYGRGIWETALDTVVTFINDAGITSFIYPTFSDHICGLSVSIMPTIKIKNFGQDTIHTLTINYTVDGGSNNTYQLSGVLLIPGTSTNVNLPSITVSPGNHTLSATSSNPNGFADDNITNDNKTTTLLVNSIGGVLPLVEGFAASLVPPANWTVNDPTLLLTANDSTGGFGNSSTCLEAYCSNSNVITYLISPAIDLSNAISPTFIDFSIAYATLYSSSDDDSLYVEISTDCGNTYYPVYAKGGASLVTAPQTQDQNFRPANNQWRAESVNIDQYIGHTGTFVRFKFVPKYIGLLFIDDINIHNGSNSIQSYKGLQQITIYPNPAHDQLTIAGLPTNENVTITVFNALGQKVFESLTTKNKIDLQNLKPGAYTVKIGTSKEVVAKKFIKQ